MLMDFPQKASTIPTIRRARPLSMARPLIGSHCRKRSTETPCSPRLLKSPCSLKPPFATTRSNRINAQFVKHPTKSPEILGLNEKPGKQTPKLRWLVSLFLLFSCFFTFWSQPTTRQAVSLMERRFCNRPREMLARLPAMGQVLRSENHVIPGCDGEVPNWNLRFA